MHAGTCVSHRVRPCLRQLLPKPVPKPSGAAVRTLQRPCSQLPRRHGFEPFGELTDMSKGAGLNSRCAQLCDEDIGGHRSAVHAYGGSCRQFLSQPPRRCTARPAQHGTEARRSPGACSCACGLLLQAIASATPPGHTGTSWRPQMRRQASRRALAHDTAAAAAAAAAATALLCPGLLHVLVLRMEAAAQTARPVVPAAEAPLLALPCAAGTPPVRRGRPLGFHCQVRCAPHEPCLVSAGETGAF